ncbi:MAG: glycosyltransferase family 2 protein [Candidatus Woesearchaeota archaeon]|jgi:dolichol-phosphate mannosyltransferase
MEKDSLSIVIPVYNEEQSIGYVLNDALSSLPKIIRNFEIIVVDDGSTDKTIQIVKIIAEKNKQVLLIHQKHAGFNKALLTGIKSATKNHVAHMQGDGQDLIRDMINCFKIMDQYDLVLGIRGRRIDYDFYRFLLSYGGMLLYRLLFNIKYEDVHWVYVWKTEELKKLKLDSRGGMFILVETLIKFREKGLRIGEATSPYRPRYAGASKNTDIMVVLKTLKSMMKTWWQMVTKKL